MKQRTRLMHNGDELLGYGMNNYKKDDGGVDNDIQLHKMKPQEHFIEAQVQEGDTLQAIALRFYCSISELKRINQIHKDNEIFARNTIKVPVTPYSVLTELVPPQHDGPTPSTSNQTNLSHEIVNVHNGMQQSNIVSLETKDNEHTIDCNAVVMNSTLAPSVVPYTDAEPSESVSEDSQLLPKDKVSVETVVVKQLTYQGADFGLKWYHLVAFLLILGVATPVIYVIFYLPKPEHADKPPL